VAKLSENFLDRTAVESWHEIFFHAWEAVTTQIFDLNRMLIRPSPAMEQSADISMTWNSQLPARPLLEYIHSNWTWLQDSQ